jgi:hypothetical protein
MELKNANYYGIYIPIAYYHTSTQCPLYTKSFKKLKNVAKFEYFTNIKDAQESGYLYPCPLCSYNIAKVIKIKIEDVIYEFPLDGLDILVLYITYIYNRTYKTLTIEKVSEILGLRKEVVKSIAAHLRRMNLLYRSRTNNRNKLIISVLGIYVIEYIRNILKIEIGENTIKGLIGNYFKEYKHYRLMEDYHEIPKRYQELFEQSEKRFRKRINETNIKLSELLKNLGDIEI